MNENQYSLHLGIAEKGKEFAVGGNYKESLRHYKEAIKMTQNQPQGETFFQHYVQCAMEAMEKMGAHEEIINYCDKFLEFLEIKEKSALIVAYIAEIEQRKALQYMHLGEQESAKELIKEIQQKVGRGTKKLVDELLTWLDRGYAISKKQLEDLQKKHRYFIVTAANLKPGIAIELPAAIQHY